MRIAVTGANGFVGRELLSLLSQAGHVAVPLVRRAAGLRDEVVTGPLEDANGRALAVRLAGIDAVVHLAALTHVHDRRANAADAFRRVNVTGTERLLDAIAAANVPRVVYMSSIKVNGEETKDDRPFSSADVPAPEDDYGRTKLQAERAVLSGAGSGSFRAIALRPPMVYGAGVGGNFGRLVAAVRRGVPLPLGRVHNRRSLISVRNLADAAIAAQTADDAGTRALTLSDGEDVSTRALVEAIGAAVGRPAHLVSVPVTALRLAGRALGRGDEVRRLTGDLRVNNNEASVALRWTPRETLRPALERMLRPSA